MIYESVQADKPIRQGDIFSSVPRVEISLSKMTIVAEDEETEVTSWREIISSSKQEPVTAVLAVEPVKALVITQNCDAARGKYLSLCQISPFLSAVGQKNSEPKSVKKWMSLLTTHAQTNLRLFYLPADQSVGFHDRMAADFRDIMRVPRKDLEGMRDFRVGRLNETATEHLRETLAQFFRRYPYNEWYCLSKDEFQAYAQGSPEPIEPYEYQK